MSGSSGLALHASPITREEKKSVVKELVTPASH